METFQEVAESQQKKEENKDASDTAGLLESLSVKDPQKEEQSKTEAPPVATEAKDEVKEEAKEPENKGTTSST